MRLHVEVEGLSDLLSDVREAGGDAKPLVKAAITNSVNRIQSLARSKAPHKTGTLQRSIQTQVTGLTGKVSVGEKYGIYQEQGTSPYTIEPKNKKALSWKGLSHPVRKVRHPGIKARPFFKPGVEDSMRYINDQFALVIARLITELKGRG